MKGAYIFDLDGTLCDATPRYKKYVEAQDNWDEFYAHCDEDWMNGDVCEVLEALAKAHFDILFVTGRRESARAKTLDWLERTFGPEIAKSEHLFMRSAKDGFCDDYVSKCRNYREHIKDKWTVRGVFEDRDQCVRAWRDLGLRCYQVDFGGY
jgi:acid phosphatase class B